MWGKDNKSLSFLSDAREGPVHLFSLFCTVCISLDVDNAESIKELSYEASVSDGKTARKVAKLSSSSRT